MPSMMVTDMGIMSQNSMDMSATTTMEMTQPIKIGLDI